MNSHQRFVNENYIFKVKDNFWSHVITTFSKHNIIKTAMVINMCHFVHIPKGYFVYSNIISYQKPSWGIFGKENQNFDRKTLVCYTEICIINF